MGREPRPCVGNDWGAIRVKGPEHSWIWRVCQPQRPPSRHPPGLDRIEPGTLSRGNRRMSQPQPRWLSLAACLTLRSVVPSHAPAGNVCFSAPTRGQCQPGACRRDVEAERCQTYKAVEPGQLPYVPGLALAPDRPLAIDALGADRQLPSI